MNALWIVLGVLALLTTGADAVDTLISTRIRAGGRWPTDIFYRVTWRIMWTFGTRIRRESRREAILSLYGPLSFIGLLALWTTGQIVGWALVWRGLDHQFGVDLRGFGDAVYYSGVVYFSVGFGDVLPASGLARILTIGEAFGGLSTMGLVIGYLPSLYGSYQSREKQLLLLDDLTDSRVTPMTLVTSMVGPDGDLSRLEAFFDSWAAWTAETFESHASFPMLMFFRSKFRGQSWVTALGVVTDAAIGTMAGVPGDHSSAMRMYRQSVRTFTVLSERLGLHPGEYQPITTEMYRYGYNELSRALPEMLPFEGGVANINRLREPLHPHMEALITVLAAPRGFWGVTSAVLMTEAEFDDVAATEAIDEIDP